MFLYNEGLSVLEAYNPINSTLNTVGVQCGEIMPIPCVSEIHYNITINIVACLQHAEIGYLPPTPHGTSFRVGLIRLRAFSTFIGH